uniref:Uncharacterized protein n=1 Tax=Heliothis virescens TaxID=7102 RepID=A0A2A4J309_HELVI
MCCGCGASCGYQIGNLVYVFEKLASIVALTAVVVCIMITVAVSLGLGMGLGYNYCTVDLKVMPDSGKSDTSQLRTRDELTEPPPNLRRTQSTTGARRTMPLPSVKNTIALPLNGEYDFPSLLSKLRARNKNVTIELIT